MLKKYTDLKNHNKAEFKKFKYYVYALCEIKNNKKIPFYIGMGKGSRCLDHLFGKTNSKKAIKIQRLLKEKENKLSIDILRHGIETKETCEVVEATCIDLMGVKELENLKKGAGSQIFGRFSLEETLSLYSTTETIIKPEHSGLAFILNKTYRSSMSPIELLEATRGTWSHPPRDQSIRFAYATYHNIVKEVYKIEGWLPAGTQQYFFRVRKLGDERLKKRWEFIGRIAGNDVRNLYLGKKIRMKRSYGTPFQKV